MTKIIALGTGSAFTMKNWHSSYLIQRNGNNLLIDGGSDLRWSLKDQGLSFKDIDACFCSHSHLDHSGQLEYLGFTRYFTRRSMIDSGATNPISLSTLFCERHLIKDLWEHTLRGGMEGLEGIDATIDTYFNVVPVDRNSSFEWEGLKFDIVQGSSLTPQFPASHSRVDSAPLET
jgi:ribonuclease BN (tRNA processing enzyme)